MEFDLNQAIDILANLCVIGGIIFLAVEIRQNNRLLSAQARYSLRQYRGDIADTLMSSAILQPIHKLANNEAVTAAEKSAVDLAALKTIELWEWQYGEYLEGMLRYESLPIGAWRMWYWGRATAPVPLREAWEIRKGVMNPGFVSFFEEKVINEGREMFADSEPGEQS
ncbi:MAG: hypothetical protein ACR2QR_10110 [Woeseiaceae bacterium]